MSQTGPSKAKQQDGKLCRRYIYRKNRLKLDLNPIKQPQPLSKSINTLSSKQHEKGDNSILGEYHYEDQNNQQYSLNEEDFSMDADEQLQLATSWSSQKWKRALQYFSSFSDNPKVTEIQSLASELRVSELQILQAWQSYSRELQIRAFSNQNLRLQKERAQQNEYLLSKLQEMVARDGTLTLSEMRNILIDTARREKRHPITNISQSKITLLLKNAGYNRRKFAPTVFQKNNKQNQIRRQEFCRYLKKLRAHNIPIYFYHETQLGKYSYRNQGWARDGERVQTKGFIDKKVMLRCLLSPHGIASWELTYNSANKRHLQSLIDKLSQQDPGYSKTCRKLLMLDKRAICNRDAFCETVQANEFDIISMPVASIVLNPIDRWFKRINNELRCEYYNTREDLMKKSECLLLRFNRKSLNWYLQYFPQEIQNCLPFA